MSTTQSPTTAAEPVRSGGRFPVRLAIALALAAITWMAPYIGAATVVLPARVEEILPDNKESVLAAMNSVGAIVSLLANILFGAFSDLTRSRFGKRSPWILLGGIGMTASMYYLSTVTSAATLIAGYALFLLFLNMLIAPMVAILSDRVAVEHRGRISSIYGTGMMIGAYGSQMVGSKFVANPVNGLLFFAALGVVSAVLFVVLAPERSNRDEPRRAFSGRMILDQFVFPRHNSRDYYLALFGKFLLQAAMYSVTNYQLYILMDYVGLSQGAAAGLIGTAAIVQLVVVIVFGLGSGPLSDKFARRKIFVILSALLVGLGMLIPFVAPFSWAMLIFFGLSSAGNGAYTSVDQALNIEVLPDKTTAAKDLGILNMANSGGQLIGPIIAASIFAGTGSYRWVFLVAMVLLVVSAALIHPIKKAR